MATAVTSGADSARMMAKSIMMKRYPAAGPQGHYNH